MNTNTKALTEASLLSALTLILILVSSFIPVLTLLAMFLGAPIFVLSRRHGFKYGASSLFVVTVLSALILGIIQSTYVLLVGGMGLAMGTVMHKGYKKSTVLMAGSIVGVIAYGILMIMMVKLSGVDYKEIAAQVKEQYDNAFNSLGIEGKIDLNQIDVMMDLFLKLIPSMVLFAGIIQSYINYLVAELILKRIKTPVPESGPFSTYSLPSNFGLGALLMLGLSYVSGKLGIVDSDVILINVLYILLFAFMIQGFAVVFNYLEKRTKAKSVKIIAIILIMVMNGSVIVSALGWMDSIFDFRKLRRSR